MAVLLAALMACVALGGIAPARAAGQSTLKIVSKTGVHSFAVELATNDDERSRGLMFRKELPEGRGMLFDFEHEAPVAFWMHNTYIPLDMIFIRGDGSILRIAENTEPLSDRLVPSGGPVRRRAGGDRRDGAQARHRAWRPCDRLDLWRQSLSVGPPVGLLKTGETCIQRRVRWPDFRRLRKRTHGRVRKAPMRSSAINAARAN